MIRNKIFGDFLIFLHLIWRIFFIDVGRYHGLVDKDVLVLPMDMTKFDSHQKCVEKVLHHFDKVDTSQIFSKSNTILTIIIS